MPFDAKAFSREKFEPRTLAVELPELAPWFGDDLPVFTVRGLTGIELAQAMDAAVSARARGELAEALLDGDDATKVAAIKDAFGLGAGVPEELIRYHELIIRGVVKPVITREISVKMAERFPVDHKGLALKILALTGQGQTVKKKPSGSGDTVNTAPA